MIRSMTAFARFEETTEAGELVWELRSVNHRYLELFLRLPDEYRQLEPVIREKTAEYLKRGKVEIHLKFMPSNASNSALAVNTEFVDQLNDALRQVSIHAPDVKSPTAMDVLRWPGVVESPKTDIKPLHKAALSALDNALQQIVEVREREGEKLGAMILERNHAALGQVELARERMPAVIQVYRDKLREKLSDLKLEPDEGRIEQEIVIAAQKLDVDEEMDRLRAHISEVERVLQQQEPIGRRLDFLMQEMNREANTLASKSADQEMTAVAVELKVLIEQMREQIQNLE